ncbi:hypothetical protein HOLleu_12410 [Holothuria leucospilota]|uniref:Uncharacterized protein n=1 Tax=Holothuria leucospilota TaxID=206669 RepID=A0A9Q1CBA8_HOLLE|nr:hypothetical protein HOLleu_12410 [Holothuria leucospilota]
MSVEPEPQSHPGAGSTHQSDQRLSSSTDHFADVANYAADGDDDSDLLGNAANIICIYLFLVNILYILHSPFCFKESVKSVKRLLISSF